MSSKDKNLSKTKTVSAKRASGYSIAIAVSEYYEEITSALKQGCIDTLKKNGVKEKNIHILPAPGAFELPLVAKWMYNNLDPDAVICLGCVIKGDTDHDKYINHAVADAIMQLNMETGTPFIFGVLTPNTMQQAKDRAGGKLGNKGVECAEAALGMLAIK